MPTENKEKIANDNTLETNKVTKQRNQARAYLITINNPDKWGYPHEVIKDKIATLNTDYFAMGDEIGEKGTYHTHIYIHRATAIEFNTIKKLFPQANIEKALGSPLENRNYIRKEGKWTDTKKSETTVKDTFEEFGKIPEEKSALSAKVEIIEAIEHGLTNEQIIRIYPNCIYHIKDLDIIRQTLFAKKYATTFRELNVSYIFGATSSGKTSHIYKVNDPADVFRVTFSKGGDITWDNYSIQPVVVFEEFHSQVPINYMLNYLDRYPLILPARYADKQACYTKVYITSNIPLIDQYKKYQNGNQEETYKAFLRRINNIIEIDKDHIVHVYKGTWETEKDSKQEVRYELRNV